MCNFCPNFDTCHPSHILFRVFDVFVGDLKCEYVSNGNIHNICIFWDTLIAKKCLKTDMRLLPSLWCQPVDRGKNKEKKIIFPVDQTSNIPPFHYRDFRNNGVDYTANYSDEIECIPSIFEVILCSKSCGNCNSLSMIYLGWIDFWNHSKHARNKSCTQCYHVEEVSQQKCLLFTWIKI